jgi:hypothetical protein
MDQDEKARENRLRRMAARQGLTLSRSRRRDSYAPDYGMYWLTRASGQRATPAKGISLDGIERYLTSPR